MKKILVLLYLFIFTTTYSNIPVYADSVYDENNQLVYYSDSYYGSEVMTIPQVSKESALEIAVNFTKEHCPEIADNINIDTVSITHTKSFPYGYNITFPRIIDGIVYRENNISFFIDSKNGQVVSFYKNFDNNLTIENNGELADTETAENTYKLAMGISLQYNKKNRKQ